MKQPKQGRPFERRNGQEGFAWEGIATKVDPAGTPPNRPRDLVNTRIQAGVIISRPGFQGDGGYVPLVPVHDVEDPDPLENPPYAVVDAIRWTPHWLGDHASAAGVKLMVVAEAIVPNGFATIGFVDTDADNAFQTVASVRMQATGYALPIEKFNNEFYFGDFSGLRKLYLVASREGAANPPVNTDQLADEVVVSYPGFRTGALQEHEGKLFFAITANGFGEIYTWDGLAVQQEFVMTADGAAGSVMVVYKDTLVVAMRDYVAPGQGALLVRDAAGAWTTFTLVGFNPSRFPSSVAEYGDLLYIMDSVDTIFTWDGATIALAHTLPAGASNLDACTKLAGRLYYGWLDTVGVKAELGCVDQDNSVAFRYNDFATRSGVRAGATPISAMATYRGRVWVSMFPSSNIFLWHSIQFVPFDGWQEIATTPAFTALGFSPGFVTNMRTL